MREVKLRVRDCSLVSCVAWSGRALAPHQGSVPTSGTSKRETTLESIQFNALLNPINQSIDPSTSPSYYIDTSTLAASRLRTCSRSNLHRILRSHC